MITLPFASYPEVRSQKILLREITPADVDNVLELTHFNRIRARDREDALDMMQKVRARYDSGESIHWGIQDLNTGEIVGCCGFYRGFPNETGEVGYMMKESFRRSGYMTEAVRLAVQFGFEQLQLRKVIAVTAQSNLASQGVLRKNGFVAAQIRENGDLVFHRLR